MPIYDSELGTWVSYEGGEDVPPAFQFLAGWNMVDCPPDPNNPHDAVTGGGPSKMELVRAISNKVKGRELTFAEALYLIIGNTTPRCENYAHKLLPGGIDNILKYVPAHKITLDDHFVLLLDEDGTNAVSAQVLFQVAERCEHWQWRLFYEVQYRFGYFLLTLIVGAVIGWIASNWST